MNITDITGADIATYGGVAAILPLIVSIINRPHFPAWAKQLIMILVALVAGVLTYGAKNEWHFDSVNGVITALIGVVAVAQIAYRVLWSKGAAPAIEQRVNGGGPGSLPDDDVDELEEDDPEDEDLVDELEADDDAEVDDEPMDYDDADYQPEHASSPATPSRV